MRLRVVLTADYEVFGDGSGCVDACLTRPTDRLLETCEQVGARLTLFVEVCAYWALCRAEQEGIGAVGASRKAIEQQLRRAVAAGHDVQLHFHPQWLGARYDAGEWRLDYGLWRLPKVAGSDWARAAGQDLEGLFRRGRETLEAMLRDAAPGYRCTAFRAGAWCIQPEHDVLPAMAAAGLRCDSSVAPGARFDDGLTRYDFSAAPSLPAWDVDGALLEPRVGGPLREVPIFTRRVGALERAWGAVARRWRGVRRYPPGCVPAGGEPVDPGRRRGAASGRAAPRVEMFGFCNVTAGRMRRFVHAARRRFHAHTAEIPLVAIGHPKEFANPAELERFLGWVRDQDDVCFDALGDDRFWPAR